MKIEYKKKFLKQLSKIPAAYRNKIEKFVFEKLKRNLKLEIGNWKLNSEL